MRMVALSCLRAPVGQQYIQVSGKVQHKPLEEDQREGSDGIWPVMEAVVK